MIRRRASFVLIASLLVSFPTAIHGEEEIDESLPSEARLLLPACQHPPFEAAALVEILGIELNQSSVELGESASEGETALMIVDTPSCDADQLTLRVERAPSGEAASQPLNIADVPREERARIIALAIAELLRSSWAELVAVSPQTPPEPSPENEPLVTVEPERVDALERELADLRVQLAQQAEIVQELSRPIEPIAEPTLFLGGAVGLRFFGQGSELIGGRVNASLLISERASLWLGVDLGYRGGSTRHRLGDVRTDALEGALALLFAGGSDSLRFAGGLELELGWAWGRGQGVDDTIAVDAVNGALVSVGLRGEIARRLRPHLWLSLILESGYTVVGIRPLAGSDIVGQLAGGFLSVDLGISYSR